MIDIEGLYNSLMTATFGGVPFGVIDTSQETGRRVQRFFFPGIDDAGYQDLGADDGPIAIRGLLVGDDYIALSRQLRAVFRSPGPYSLVHPWLGSFQVVHQPGQRPKISFAANELRVARFEITCLPFKPEAQPGLDTLSALAVQCDELKADAQNWMAAVVAPVAQLVGAFGYVQNFLSNVATTFDTALGANPASALLLAAAAAPIALLDSPTSAPSPTWAATTAAQLIALPVAVAGACTPLVPAAVAPGGPSTAAAPADPTDTVNALLATIPGITATASNPPPGPALAAAMQAVIVTAAVQASANIVYDSAQAAQAEGQVLYAALDAAIFAAATAAASDTFGAAPVWRDLVGVKAALAADLNALIGRLPEVVTITIPAVMPAWIIAQYISGDTPADVFATYQDIVARNDVVHPALVPPGPFEVLNQ